MPKIRSVVANNRRRSFEVRTASRTLSFPYARVAPRVRSDDSVSSVRVDRRLASEGFSFALRSGKEGSVHVEQVLEYNQDPDHLREILLYNLTVEAQKRLETTRLAKREIIRRLGTSASQFYRLVDQTNYRKSIDQMLSLLYVLDCDVDVVVSPHRGRRMTSRAIAR